MGLLAVLSVLLDHARREGLCPPAPAGGDAQSTAVGGRALREGGEGVSQGTSPQTHRPSQQGGGGQREGKGDVHLSKCQQQKRS